jgi:sec-independent protein translocase protein TatA
LKKIKKTKFGFPESLFILTVVLLLFGVGRIIKIAGEFGKGIHSFRKGLKGNDDKEDSQSEKGNKTKKRYSPGKTIHEVSARLISTRHPATGADRAADLDFLELRNEWS